jgi:hypothetical protein
MKFIDIILQNSQAKEAKLLGPATKASTNPETGVTILNPAAFHVIRDCATLAIKYLPHYVFGLYANPFEVLKNKFEYPAVVEFVKAALSDMVLHQLLLLITEKIKKSSSTLGGTDSDPYGDYESYNTVDKEQTAIVLICQAFGVNIPK